MPKVEDHSGEQAFASAMVNSVTTAMSHPVLDEPATRSEDHKLLVAHLAGRSQAKELYEDLHNAEFDDWFKIDGIVVADADQEGEVHVRKMTEHSTRSGLMWGAVGGAIAAVFLPATIVGGAVALGIAGAGAGKARNKARQKKVAGDLDVVVAPGTSAVLCLSEGPHAEEIADIMRSYATELEVLPVDANTLEALQAVGVATAAAESAQSPHEIPWEATRDD